MPFVRTQGESRCRRDYGIGVCVNDLQKRLAQGPKILGPQHETHAIFSKWFDGNKLDYIDQIGFVVGLKIQLQAFCPFRLNRRVGDNVQPWIGATDPPSKDRALRIAYKLLEPPIADRFGRGVRIDPGLFGKFEGLPEKLLVVEFVSYCR